MSPLSPLTRMKVIRELRLDVSRGGAAYKAVLFVLASRAHSEAYVPAYGPYAGRTLAATSTWCSLQTLGSDAGIRLSATRVVLTQLEELGLVTVERPPGRPPIITLDDDRLSDLWQATQTPPVNGRGTPPVSEGVPHRSTNVTPPVSTTDPTGKHHRPLPETTPEVVPLKGTTSSGPPKGDTEEEDHPTVPVGGVVGVAVAGAQRASPGASPLRQTPNVDPTLQAFLDWYASVYRNVRGEDLTWTKASLRDASKLLELQGEAKLKRRCEAGLAVDPQYFDGELWRLLKEPNKFCGKAKSNGSGRKPLVQGNGDVTGETWADLDLVGSS